MKKSLSLTIILLVLLLFTGCVQQVQKPEEDPITGLDNGAVKVIREDEGPSQGGTLNLFMQKPDTLNPLTSQNPTVRHLSSFVFDGLYNDVGDGNVEEALVNNVNVSQDGLILDIELRDNVQFHDGQALTSDDVAFSIETIQSAGSRSLYSEHVANIQDVKAVNRLNVRIVLGKPDIRIKQKLTFPVIPQHVFKDWPIEGHSDDLKLIGTGPFRFDSYKDNAVTLLRNDAWWNLEVPDGLNHPIWLDGITFKVYPDESSMMQAFQKQEIDIAWLDDGELDSYAKRSDIFFNQYEGNTLEFLLISVTGRTYSPVVLEEFRTLVMKYLCSYMADNPLALGEPAFYSVSGFPSDENAMSRENMLEALKTAGFTYQEDKNLLIYNKEGAKIPVELSVKYNGLNGERQAVSDRIASALFEIGIKVVSESPSYSEQQAFVKSGKFDMMLLGCKIPLYADMTETMDLLKESLGVAGQDSVILPLYRKNSAVLYHNRLRGARTPVWENIYNGWSEWYLVQTQP